MSGLTKESLNRQNAEAYSDNQVGGCCEEDADENKSYEM